MRFSVVVPLYLFSSSPLLFLVLVGISFLSLFLACVVSRYLIAPAAFFRFSLFVGLVLALWVAASTLQAPCVLVVSGVSSLFLVLVGRRFVRWVLAASLFFLRPLFYAVEVGLRCSVLRSVCIDMGNSLFRRRSSGTFPFVLRSVSIHLFLESLQSGDSCIFLCFRFHAVVVAVRGASVLCPLRYRS